MQIKIKRIDPTLPLPAYQTAGSVAFDLYSREAMTIAPKTIGLIPTNFIIQTPPGYMLIITPRSSTPKRKGLLIPHGVGVIDQDYCGQEDEIKLQLYNFTDTIVSIDCGERIGQAALVRVDQAEWTEVAEMGAPSRAGFGSTGVF